MMNEINSDQDVEENGSKNLRTYIFNRFKELEPFIVLVIMGIAPLILLGILLDAKSLDMTGLLSYLVIAFLFVVVYSVVTTRTGNVSFTEKLKQIIKRFIDIMLAFVGLYLLSPFFLFTAIAVKIESPGPVFFYTMRLGQFGKPFRVLKFRTMHLAPRGGPTKVGNFLSQTHLNQLPQLWNVLTGDMSLADLNSKQPDDSENSRYA
jgi:hypothetical protein